MICLLCLGVEIDENLIDIVSGESRRQNIPSILHTHFGFCFQVEPCEGCVCQKCWVKVSVFHEFYTHVEYVHHSNDIIFVQNIAGDMKSSMNSVDENSEYSHGDEAIEREEEMKSDDAVRTEETEISYELNINNEPQRRKGRPRKDDPVKPRSTKCSRCPLKFPSFRTLYRHINEVHVVLPFGCKQQRCAVRFASEQERDAHFATKHKQSECPHCNKMLLEKTIEHHIKMQHQTNDSQVICDLCGQTSSTLSRHNMHYRKMHEVHSKVQCDICKEWTKHKDSLRRHMIRKHINGPQKCTICGHTSPNRSALRDHAVKHLPDHKTRFKYVQCDRGFRNKTILMEHSHTHTGFAGQYECKDCGKVFRFNSSYYIHRKKMHPK